MHKKKITFKDVIKKVAAYLLLLIIWAVLYEIVVNRLKIWKSYSFPAPLKTFQTLLGLVSDNVLLIGILASLKRIIIGFFISLVIGTLFGLIIAKVKYIKKNYAPIILGLQTLPSICWLPFAILWFGLGESTILFVVIISAVFAITISIQSGISSIDPIYIKAGKTMGAKGLKLYTSIMIPASLPSFVMGAKQAWSFAWRGLMAGEMLTATKGLGYILMMGRELADINQVMAIMLVIITLGLSVDRLVFGNLEKKIKERWGF